MSAFPTAMQDFISALRRDPYAQVAALFQAAHEAAAQADADEANWALPHLAEWLSQSNCPYPAFLANLCERCMRAGGEPWIATGLLVYRLSTQLDQAARFYQACLAQLASRGIQAGPTDKAFQEAMAEPTRQSPTDAFAWAGLPLMCLTVRPLLEHFAPARVLFRTLPGSVETLDRLAGLATDIAAVAGVLVPVSEEEANQGDPREAVSEALRDLEAAGQTSQESMGRVRNLMSTLFCVPPATRDDALRGLGELIGRAPCGLTGQLAQTAGSLVEIGCDAAVSIDPILARLPEVLAGAGAFVAACSNEAGDTRKNNAAGLVQAHGAAVAKRLPNEAAAWQALGPMCLGTIAHLSRLPAVRQRIRSDSDLLTLARAVSGCNGPANFLVKMLQVLDGEELVVLSPPWGRGYRVRIGGVADNFQLHTLLAGALVGPEERGLMPGVVGMIGTGHSEEPMPGRPLAARAVGVTRDLPAQHREPSVYSYLQLWNWTALSPDGTLPNKVMAASDHFIWNEGVPADIAPFEGTRVVLVGTAPFSRSWNGGRIFHGMNASFEVLETLDAEAVTGWLGRISAQSQGSPPGK